MLKMPILVINGVKMYPVGNYLIYQHVFSNAIDKAQCQIYELSDEGKDTTKAEEWLEKVNDLFDKWMSNPQKNGCVYATYEDYSAMKDIIGAYAWNHGGSV